MLDATHTNRQTCTVCGWTRIIDHTREYRGGHTHPDTAVECYGMLSYELIDTRVPDPAWFEEEDPSFTPTW